MSEKRGTGIIIRRFQVFRLSDIHERLIASVQEQHERVIVFSAQPAPA
jgi:hypothetical protein